MPEGNYVYLDSVLMGYFVYGLVLVRVGGMVLTAQFFSAQQFPQRVRAGMAAFFALCCLPAASATFNWPQEVAINAAELMLLAGQEMVIGVLVGLLSTLIFYSAALAGEIAGQQIGFAMANVLDPMTNIDVSIIGFLWSQMAALIFLVLNLHLYLILLVCYSFEVLPIGKIAFDPFLLAMLEGMCEQTDGMYLLGVQIAMPVILVMLLTSTIIGFVTRTMPQMNIMVFGMPLRIVLGLMVIIFMIPGLCETLAGGGIADIWLEKPEGGALRDMLDTVYETVDFMRGSITPK